MAYCGPKGIPLSEFLSWDESDQDAALMWQAHEGRRCSSCGTHPDDWNSEVGGRRDAYRPEVVVCPGCAAIDAIRERQDKSASIHGAHVILRPPEEV